MMCKVSRCVSWRPLWSHSHLLPQLKTRSQVFVVFYHMVAVLQWTETFFCFLRILLQCSDNQH